MWEGDFWKGFKPHLLPVTTPVWALEHFSDLRVFWHIPNTQLSFVGVKKNIHSPLKNQVFTLVVSGSEIKFWGMSYIQQCMCMCLPQDTSLYLSPQYTSVGMTFCILC